MEVSPMFTYPHALLRSTGLGHNAPDWPEDLEKCIDKPGRYDWLPHEIARTQLLSHRELRYCQDQCEAHTMSEDSVTIDADLDQGYVPAKPFADTAFATPVPVPGSPNASPISEFTDTEVGSGTRATNLATPGLPSRIDRYLIIRQLGAGGMGVVAEAYDPELDRKLAIKILRDKHQSASPLRLIREAQALARLSHPNVVQVHDVGFDDQRVFIAMELIQGQTLATWMGAEQRPWQDVVDMFVQAAEGLRAAHAEGLIHRDFKPENVLVDAEGRPRVVDFGLARELSFEPQTSAPNLKVLLNTSMTRTGAIMGTPAYMAPEQWLGQEATKASDVFAFCVALVEALYGERPFAGNTIGELALAVHDGNWNPPPQPNIPAWLVAVLRRGLATSPDERYSSMDELLEELRRDRHVLRRRLISAGVLVAAMSSVGLGAWAYANDEPCTGVGERIVEVWNPTAEASIAEAIDDENLRKRVADGLKEYADAWDFSAGEACHAHARQEVSSEIYGQQLRCHERARRSLEQAIRSVSADDVDLRQLPAMLARLPALAFCNDLDVLAAEVPPPQDRQQAYEVAQVQGRLAELLVMANAGQTERALLEVQDLSEPVQALSYTPLTAERELREGQIALVAQQWKGAYEALDRALNAAIVARRDDIAAEAQTRLIFLISRLGDTERARELRGLAEAWVERVPGRPDLEAMLKSNVGLLLLNSGDREAAEPLLEQALHLAESTPLANPIDIAWNYRFEYANSLTDSARKQELFQQSKRELVEQLGDTHALVLRLDYLIATSTSSPEDVLERLDGTCQAYATHYPELADVCLHCGALQAQFFDAMGRQADAAEAMTQALTCRIEPKELAIKHRLFTGERLLFANQPEAAEQQFAKSIDELGSFKEWWNQVLFAQALLGRGRALLALGRANEAVLPLDRARSILEPIATTQKRAKYGDLLARTNENLAQAISRSDAAATEQEKIAALRTQAVAYYRSAGKGYEQRVANIEQSRP